MRSKVKLAIATILVIGTAVIGVVLGTWQVQRLQWKHELIEQLDTAYENPTIIDLKQLDQNQSQYIYGKVSGTLDYSKEIYLGPTTHKGVISKQVITPLNTPQDTIFVVRGYIPIDEIETYTPPQNNTAVIEGLIKEPSWNNFTSNNNPAQDIWVKPDIEEISNHLSIKDVVPYFLYAHSIAPNTDRQVQLPDEKWYPRNKHIQYALFWFAMSGIVILFFGFIFLKKRKSSN